MPEDEQPELSEVPSPSAPAFVASLETAIVPEGTEAEPPPIPAPAKPRGIAPIWHTVLLIAAILGFSYWGADRGNPVDIDPIAPVPAAAHSGAAAKPAPKTAPDDKPAPTSTVRLIRYGLSGVVEVVLVGWIAFGLYLRGVSFRSILGAFPRDLNSATLEFGVAALFWICSMVVLGCMAFGWNAVQQHIYDRSQTSEPAAQSKSTPQNIASGTDGKEGGKQSSAKPPEPSAKKAEPESPKQQQARMIQKLMELAPASAIEVVAWGLLCLLVGFSEEIIFRGYLQTQGIALLRSIPIGMILSALIFGGAHGYQGMRGMCIITVYGALFGGIALLRRSLLPGMIAHSWHDFFTGMMLMFLRSSHLLDKLQS